MELNETQKHLLETARTRATRWNEREELNRVLLVTRGHGFARDPFFAMFESNSEIEYSNVEHPAAQRFFTPELAREFDCFVLYDMPGIEVGGAEGPVYFEPPDFFKEGLEAMTREGFPLVVLHHALAGWSGWPEWSEIVGAQFLWRPSELRGQKIPDSGYLIGVNHTVSPAIDHPITKGIEPFELLDELYLMPIFEDSIVPLFRSDFEFVDSNFYSAARATEGHLDSREGWSHPPGSNVVGWIKSYRNSPIVCLQFGDGPSAFENESCRAMLANAIRWACSEEARVWARERSSAGQ